MRQQPRIVLTAAMLVLALAAAMLALAFMAGASSPVRSVECPCRK